MQLTDADRERSLRLRREAGLVDQVNDPSALAQIHALVRATPATSA